MLRRTKLLLLPLLLTLPLLGFAVTAHAHNFRSGDNITVPSGRIVDSTLFAAGRNIDVAGRVDGDLFCAGQTIHVTGTVRGDVICAGQNISISGRVDGDVRLAGQSISISGSVGQNATIAGQSLTTSGGSRVGGDLAVGSTDAVLNGTIGRDVSASSDTIIVNGAINRDIKANVEHLRLGSDSNVGGTVDYTSPRKLNQQRGAEVSGAITRHEPAKHERVSAGDAAPWFLLFLFISMLLVALVLVLLLPRTFHVAGDLALASPLKTFLIGLASTVLVPVVLLALAFSIVGIPLALLGGLMWLLVVVLSGPFAAYLLGRAILRGQYDNAILTMLFGAVLLLLLYMIPVLNLFVGLLALWFGVGMIMQRVVFQRPQYNFAHATAARDDTGETKVVPARNTAKATSSRSRSKTSRKPSAKRP